MADLFARPPAQRTQEGQTRQARTRAAQNYAANLPPEIADVIKTGGRTWWLKPGVWEAMARTGASAKEWDEVARLALNSDPKWKPSGSIVKASTLKPKKKNKRNWLEKAAGALADAGDEVNDFSASAVRTTTRLAATAVSAPWEEAQGIFRSGVNAALHSPEGFEAAKGLKSGSGLAGRQAAKATPNPTPGVLGIEGEGFVGSQSSFGILASKFFDGEITLGQVLGGSEKALGSGFLPGGDVRVEQASRAWRSAHIGDLSLTPGRFVAATILEPGSMPFNVISGAVDAGLITTLDPINPVLARAGNAVKAGRYFDSEAVGLLGSGNRTAVSQRVEHWMNSKASDTFKTFMTDTTDPVKILKATKWKMPVEAAVRIADTTDPTEVRGILGEVMGFGFNYKPKGWHYTDAGVAIRTSGAHVRWLNNMPKAGLIDRTNADAFTRQINDYLLNAKVDPEISRGIVERTARATSGNHPGETYTALTAAAEAVNASLVATGIPGRTARGLTRHWKTFEKMRAYNIDAIKGLERPLPSAIARGVEIPAPTPQMLEQFLGRMVPFPDVGTLREIRTRTGAFGKQMGKLGKPGNAALEAELHSVRALDQFYKTWKPFQILRGAYIARVVGDEQARMASTGLDSMFGHPLAYFAAAMGDDGRLGKLLDSVPTEHFKLGRYGTDITGQGFKEMADDSEYATTLYRSVTDLFNQGGKRSVPGGHIPLRLKTEVGIPEPGAVEAWADNLKLLHDNQFTRMLAEGRPLREVQEEFFNSSYRSEIIGSGQHEALEGLAAQVSTRVGADEYVADVLTKWVEDVTAGDQRLIDTIVSGKTAAGKRLHKNMKVTKDGRTHLQDLVDTGVGPTYVAGSPAISTKATTGEAYDMVIDFAFDLIAVRPSNWASRSPAFRQFYWKHVEALLGDASPEARAKILGVAAREAKVPPKMLKRLEGIPSSGALDIDDINLLAGRYAADQTKKLLYDLSNRNQAWDSLRLMFPFGEAYKEVMTTWAKLLSENPKSLRTLQRGVEGARGAGFFYEDPTTGEEMFSIPGSGQLVEALTGIEGADFRATASGLSIAGSLAPGFGPTVQWAAGTFLPDKPEFNFVRDIIFQFGGEGEGIVDILTPGWADKLKKWDNSPDSDRQFNSAVGEVLNHLASTGDYDLQNRDDLVRLQDDAIEKAQDLYVIRGVLQFFAPSAPRQSLGVKTKIGTRVTAALYEEFKKYQDDDYETAYAKFVTKFGERAIAAIVPRSKANVGGLDSTTEFADFQKSNSHLFKKFKDVAGFFAPSTDEDIDLTEYERQFRTGQRSTIPQSDRLAQANAILGQMAFDQQKALLPANPNKAQQAWLGQVRDELIAEYPGFDPKNINLGRIGAQVRHLELAAKEPSMRDNPVAIAVRDYFSQRKLAIEASGVRGWDRAKSAKPQRDWLRDVAAEIIDEHPEFARVWDHLLSRELADDVEEG